jgi:hypothetical protein
MRAPTTDLVVGDEVLGLLRKHNAEGSFRTASRLVRECFPQADRIEVYALDDPDEDGHTWVGFDLHLPPAITAEQARALKKRYNAAVLAALPLDHLGLFGFHAHPQWS